MNRWVGLGIIADNLVNVVVRWKSEQPRKAARPIVKFSATPVTPARFVFAESTDHNAANVSFAPGSRLAAAVHDVDSLDRPGRHCEQMV